MRTEQSLPQQSTHTGKWSAVFITWGGLPGSEFVMNQVTSAAVFATDDEAREGGLRALDVLEKTGVYPNMCEVF